MTVMSFTFDPQRTAEDLHALRKATAKTGSVPSWSYSALKNYESCPHRIYLSKVEKHPEPSSAAMDRGTAIHLLGEEFVQGNIIDLPQELEKFKTEFTTLRERYNQAKVILEQDWGFTRDWGITGWSSLDTWLRMKLDAYVQHDDQSATIIDYKTGRKFGNEINHLQQAQLYAIGAFKRFPLLQYVECEFWYLDKGETLSKKYTREEAEQFVPKWDMRGIQMTSDTSFTPNPSKYNCKWCPHLKTEVCKWGVA